MAQLSLALSKVVYGSLDLIHTALPLFYLVSTLFSVYMVHAILPPYYLRPNVHNHPFWLVDEPCSQVVHNAHRGLHHTLDLHLNQSLHLLQDRICVARSAGFHNDVCRRYMEGA
jgi:hypothetical protein